ncbi:MAG: YesL family protein [Oscillospiraceae bacterium]|nr:YesL family protein [Oscillospiraceae bacterium]
MFRTVFNPANGFWRAVARVCDVFGLSVCWLVTSLPIFTVGAATTALYDAVFHGVRRGEPGDYIRFFRTFRQNFRTATLVTLPFLLIAAAIFGVWYVTYVMALDGSDAAFLLVYAYRVLMCVPLAVWLFAMFTLSRFEFAPRALLSTAARLAMGHLPSAAVVAFLVIECAMSVTRWGVLPLIVMPGIAALLCSLFMERIFAPYLPREEDPPEEAEGPNEK